MAKKDMLLAGDAFGILNTMNNFNVRTRGDNKILDNLEGVLMKAVEGKTSAEQPTEVSVSDIQVLTEDQFDNFIDGVPLPRGTRKRLGFLLVQASEDDIVEAEASE